MNSNLPKPIAQSAEVISIVERKGPVGNDFSPAVR